MVALFFGGSCVKGILLDDMDTEIQTRFDIKVNYTWCQQKLLSIQSLDTPSIFSDGAPTNICLIGQSLCEESTSLTALRFQLTHLMLRC